MQRKLEGGSSINADATGADGRSNVCCSRRRTHAPDPFPTFGDRDRVIRWASYQIGREDGRIYARTWNNEVRMERGMSALDGALADVNLAMLVYLVALNVAASALIAAAPPHNEQLGEHREYLVAISTMRLSRPAGRCTYSIA